MVCPRPVIELNKHLTDVDPGGADRGGVHGRRRQTRCCAGCAGTEYVGEDQAADGTPRYLVRRVG